MHNYHTSWWDEYHGRQWQSHAWHGYMNKLDPIASNGYVENLRLVGLSEYGDP